MRMMKIGMYPLELEMSTEKEKKSMKIETFSNHEIINYFLLVPSVLNPPIMEVNPKAILHVRHVTKHSPSHLASSCISIMFIKY